MAGRRLHQVDATRPVKQAAVVSTHVLLILAPGGTWFATGAALTLLHVARNAFFFISSCMLVYAYASLTRSGLRTFYWRRFVSVGIPYLCWTAIYYVYTFHQYDYGSVSKALWGIPHMLYTGYYHLYFLLVIAQFYIVFPLVLWLLRKTTGHHGLLAAALIVYQFAWVTLMHWHNLPTWVSGVWAQRLLPTYLLYLIGGSIIGLHMEEVHEWVMRNWMTVVVFTAVTAIGAEVIYDISETGGTHILGSSNDPFQPSVIPFNIGAIACLYLIGVWLTHPQRSQHVRRLVNMGSDDAYGIYLAQMIFINALLWLGWMKLNNYLPWPLVLAVAVVIVYLSGVALTELLARTPLSVALVGRKRVPWPTRINRTDSDSDTTVDGAERSPAGRHRLSRGRRVNGDDDVLGAAEVSVGVGTAAD
jgi:peptidoglycan/LPS O-acetylase OafA/YrhL